VNWLQFFLPRRRAAGARVLTTNLKFNQSNFRKYNILMFSAEPGKILYQFGGAANSPDEAIIDI
jgi:hypothetical protein